MHRLIASAVIAATSACGPPAPPSGPHSAAPAPDGKLPVGAPLVTPGERMHYKVSLKGIELAAYTFSVGEVGDLDGKRAVPVSGQAKLVGLAQFFAGKVDDRFTSWIDVETGRALRFQVDEYGSRSSDIEHTVVDIAKRDGDTIPVTFHLNDDAPAPEPQKASLPETWDYNAFLVLLRAWEGPPGTRTSLEVFRSRNMWNIALTIRGKTQLVTALGELPALRFDAHTYKLARDGSRFPDTDERDFSVWVSDDAGRVPLRVDAVTDYGAVQMEITDYHAGSGEPLRR